MFINVLPNNCKQVPTAWLRRKGLRLVTSICITVVTRQVMHLHFTFPNLHVHVSFVWYTDWVRLMVVLFTANSFMHDLLIQSVLMPFRSSKIFVHASLSGATTDIYFEFKDKNAVNHAFQYMRNKPLINWQVCNQ